MDDLSISPEELSQIIGGDKSTEPEPANSGGSLTQDDINRMLAQQSGGDDAPASSASPPAASTQISAEELAQITGGGTTSGVATPSFASASNLTAQPAQFAPLQPSINETAGTNLDLLMGVNLRVSVELGRAKMSIAEILKLGPGSVIELDKLAGEPVDVLINDRLIARGEVVVIEDRFGVRITDVVPPAERVHSM